MYHQQTGLNFLRSSKNLVVLKTDKNLGPAVLERSIFIQRVYEEHLLTKDYRQLSHSQANGRFKAITRIVRKHISTFHMKPNERNDRLIYTDEGKFILFHLKNALESDPFSYFYLLPKVHKNPWTTRPIVSYSGSLLYGIAKWLDSTLQKIVDHIPYTVHSSKDFVDHLQELHTLPPSATLCTIDAKSMYTNIDTNHAITVLSTFLNTSTYATGIDPNACIDAIKIVMRHNIFKFGDTYWVQMNGTAMGTPPAPTYAQLYYLVHELTFVRNFPQILF